MIFKKNIFSFRFLYFVFCFSCAFCPELYGQEIKNIDYFLKDSTRGKANYYVSKNKKNDLKNGKFEFQSTSIDTLSKAIKSTNYKGYYKNNYKNQKWEFSFLELSSGNSSSVKDYELIKETSGKEFLVEGSFINGVASNEWRVVKHEVKNSKIIDTLYFAKTNFRAGNFNGDLVGWNKKMKIKIFVDQDTYLNGNWKIEHKSNNNVKVEEYRLFDNGILKSHYFLVDNIKINVNNWSFLPNQNSEDYSWESIVVDKEYFDLISFANQGFDKENKNITKSKLDSLIISSNSFFEFSFLSFSNLNETLIWSQLEGSEEINLPKAKLRKFVFSASEKKELKDLYFKIINIEQKLNNFFQNTKLDVVLYAYKDINNYYNWLKIHQLEFIKLKEFHEKIQHPGFEYVDRTAFFESIKPKITFPSVYTFSFKDENYTVESSLKNLEFVNNYDLKALNKYVLSISDDIDNSIEKANTFVLSYQNQTALKVKEEVLIQKRDTILNLFLKDSKEDDFNDYHFKIATPISEFTNSIFKAYASKSLETKKEEIDYYISCMDNILIVYEKWKDIPRRLNRIDELYKRSTFNPYTLTNMEERMKARLYESYEEILLPYFLEVAFHDLACEKLSFLPTNFEALYRKMIDLREKDTKVLERQLRRIKNPKEIISILSLEIN